MGRIVAPNLIETPDGVRLYWQEVGCGRPILFLNSWAMTTRMWDLQIAAFSDNGFRCIAFDRRGHGRSDRPPGGFDSDTFADDLAAVIEALDLRALTLVSHSMAAGEVVRYLSRHGAARITRAVLIAPTTPFLLKSEDNPNGLPEELFKQTWAAWKQDFPKWVADNAAPFFTPQTSVALMRWAIDILLEISLPVALATNRAAVRTDFRREMTLVDVPVLILHGDHDASAPLALTGEPSARLIPGARLNVYEGGPHGLMYTHMDRLNADILQFIGETRKP
ncbi:MAG: alpha/beta hydrolase [Methylobacteriaceae bacterium]|nr:alpha/beta hydrolase [Methylobacteriaceae bacterium]